MNTVVRLNVFICMYLDLCVSPRLPESIYAKKLKKRYQPNRPGLYECRYVYMTMCACYMCVCAWLYLCMWPKCMFMYVCILVCDHVRNMSACVAVCMSVYKYDMCVNAYMCVWMCVHMWQMQPNLVTPPGACTYARLYKHTSIMDGCEYTSMQIT